MIKIFLIKIMPIGKVSQTMDEKGFLLQLLRYEINQLVLRRKCHDIR
jgi:hypothetical protein